MTQRARRRWRRRRAESAAARQLQLPFTPLGQPAGKVDMKNIAMVFTRQHHGDEGWSHVFVTALPIDAAALDSFDIAYIAPLYIYPYEIPPGSEGQQALFTPDTLPPRMIRHRPNAEGAA